MKNVYTAVKLLAALCVAPVLVGCDGGGDGSDPFVFRTDAADRYARVDRMGEPALATALLSKNVNDPIPVDQTGKPINPGSGQRFNTFDDQRDALNRGEPANDARDFAFMLTQGPQINALANYHYKLGPQLRSLGLKPCSTETAVPPSGIAQVDISTCVAQAAPVILPDVVTLDSNVATSWPNGRSFDDPVVDRLLAAALLDISTPGTGQNLNSLVGVINPTKDETGTASPSTFPHLRPAHPFP